MSKSQTMKIEALARLREMVKAGDTVLTILRHVSRSGMNRSISPVVDMQDIGYLVARVGNDKMDQTHGGIKQTGCGMDMGFNLVYNLSRDMFPDGFGCVGEGCPSNDHSNGDRSYVKHWDKTPGKDALTFHWHKDGGYALKQRWL